MGITSYVEVLGRGLPPLVTTTSSVSSSATSGSATSGSGTTNNSQLPSFTSFLSSFTTPVITPPSAANNPNIKFNNKPVGTVFIVVGSVVGAIFLAILLWYIITAYISHRNTKRVQYYAVEKQFQSGFPSSNPFDQLYHDDDDDSDENEKQSMRPSSNKKMFSHNRIRLLGSDMNSPEGSTIAEYASSLNVPQERYSVLTDSPFQNRASLFISPTVEVMNQPKKNMLFQHMNYSLTSVVSDIDSRELTKPERALSPEERKHKSNKSSLSHVIPNNNDSPARVNSQQKQKMPSMFLNDMLDD